MNINIYVCIYICVCILVFRNNQEGCFKKPCSFKALISNTALSFYSCILLGDLYVYTIKGFITTEKE